MFDFVGEEDDPGTATTDLSAPPTDGRNVPLVFPMERDTLILKETAGYTRPQDNTQHLHIANLRAASVQQASLLLFCTRSLGNRALEGTVGGGGALMNQYTLHSAHTESIKKHERLGENNK